MSVPYWVQDAVFYQIFPDRFANGNKLNDPPNVQPWGSTPTGKGFQGGDLQGILSKMNYLLDLGVNTLYLNPIFLSASNHGYNTFDYFSLDPRLGDMRDFHALIESAHANQMRVILDGVFNHCGRGFFAFADLLENQESSAYRDWFHVKKYPVDAYTKGEPGYSAWWGHNSLPKFNTGTLAVRRYLLQIARFWIEQGADGWRLDVPNEIDDDAFWAEFRQTVKSANREAYILGEIWTADQRWVGANHFDGLMNYPLREALLDFLSGTSTATGYADRIDTLLTLYPEENTYAMYNLLGSHDTERVRTKLADDLNKLKSAYTLLFAYPGAPAIYYGDEIGLSGGKDPECRGAFPWDKRQWHIELQSWIKNLIHTRRRFPALRRGDYLRILADDRLRCHAFARRLGDENILVVVNASPTLRHLRIPVGELNWSDGRIMHDLLGYGEYLVSGDTLVVRVPAWASIWIG